MTSPATIAERGLEGVVAGSTGLSNVEGAAGRLTYRGYDIGDLAARCSFEEVAYLLLFGTLPNRSQLADFGVRLAANRALPPQLIDFLKALPPDARPMDVLRTAVSALGVFLPHLDDGSPGSNPRSAIHLIAKTPVIVAAWDRIRRGLEPIAAQPNLATAANLLYMLSGRGPLPEAERALDTYLVLLADHSFNASTFAARVTASTRADIFAAATTAVGTLAGDLHGGAPAKVMAALMQIGTPERAEAYVRETLGRGERIMGMGHREYKVRDPRASVLEATATSLGEVADPRWLDVARALEAAAVRVLAERDPENRVHANVEFYTAPTLFSLGIPADEFTCVFACARMAGWTAHVLEQLAHNRLIRPQAAYTGPAQRTWAALERRDATRA